MTRTNRRRVNVISSRLKAFTSFLEEFSFFKTSWKTLRGTWVGALGIGSSPTPASQYPLAVVKMSKSNTTTSINAPAPGTGIAIWTTDSGNWWGVVTGQNGATDCNCQTCSTCNAYQCNAYQCNAFQCNSTYTVCNYWVPLTCENYNTSYCASYNSNNCASYNSSNCSSYNTYNSYLCWLAGGTYCGTCKAWNTSFCASWNGTNCASWNGVNCSRYSGGFCGASSSWCNASSCISSSCSSASCISASYYSCNCQTCYPATIRVIRSLSNTVTEITSWVVGTLVQGLRVITSGTSITAKAYSDNTLTTQIGSDLTYQANGATIDTSFGIVVSPSVYGQGASLTKFTATTN